MDIIDIKRIISRDENRVLELKKLTLANQLVYPSLNMVQMAHLYG